MDSAAPAAALRKLPLDQRVITALDVPDPGSACTLAAALGERGRIVKIGLELFTAAGPAVLAALRDMNKEVFLDLKYKDIPNTVAGAVGAACGLGVVMMTLHADGGRRMMEAAVEAAEKAAGPGQRRPALLAVTVLTSLNLAEADETAPGGGPLRDRIVRLARLALDSGCDGVVCSPRDLPALRDEVGGELLAVTPGVRPAGSSDDDQCRVATPAEAMKSGADFLVVGRPITRAGDPAAALLEISQELSSA
ncbi:orotidine-5'-phosphate decarboxylase [bacterium]|nr:orotidine-5'-phosphate decarboxylase [bacterium]MBU1074040.1 orotidine-5'-phosphate decarboxylase [bacterium]MBU1675863.1 orotidine-5'-phosphate decarboxylase [bacterium]